MRWYGIDDLSAEDTARLAQALEDMGIQLAGMDGLYWLPVPAAWLRRYSASIRRAVAPMCWAWSWKSTVCAWSCWYGRGAVCVATVCTMPGRNCARI